MHVCVSHLPPIHPRSLAFFFVTSCHNCCCCTHTKTHATWLHGVQNKSFNALAPHFVYSFLVNVIDLVSLGSRRPQSQRPAAEKKRGILTYTREALPQPPQDKHQTLLRDEKHSGIQEECSHQHIPHWCVYVVIVNDHLMLERRSCFGALALFSQWMLYLESRV